MPKLSKFESELCKFLADPDWKEKESARDKAFAEAMSGVPLNNSKFAPETPKEKTNDQA